MKEAAGAAAGYGAGIGDPRAWRAVDEGNRDAAVDAATAAYRLAWCDGPPFAHDYGLRTARAHLRTLAAPEPELPPYDASQHEPIEEIPIEPEDE